MKNIYLTFALLFCIYTNAQNYTFLKTTATYTDLVSTTSLNNDEIWDDPEYSLTLPFSFTINGISTSNVTVSDSYIFLSDATLNSHIISAYGIDLVDRGNNSGNSLSPISYKIDGISPNRIVKIEFKNCGAFNDNALTMFVNFQIWLFETTNVFEFRYGSNFVNNPSTFYDNETGGIIGTTTIDTATDATSNEFFLTSGVSNPTTTTFFPSFVTGTPTSGTLYRFTPTSLNTTSFSKDKILIYPNPANEILTIDGNLENNNYQIFNCVGKLVLSGNLSLNKIEVTDLPKGIYFLKLKDNITFKFLKN